MCRMQGLDIGRAGRWGDHPGSVGIWLRYVCWSSFFLCLSFSLYLRVSVAFQCKCAVDVPILGRAYSYTAYCSAHQSFRSIAQCYYRPNRRPKVSFCIILWGYVGSLDYLKISMSMQSHGKRSLRTCRLECRRHFIKTPWSCHSATRNEIHRTFNRGFCLRKVMDLCVDTGFSVPSQVWLQS